MIAYGKKLCLHDGVKSHGIDGDSRTLSDYDEEGALELKVDENSNVVGTLLGLGQFSKDQEASPTLTALCHTHTLPDSGKRLEIAFCHATGSHHAQGHDPSVQEEDVGNDDGNGKDPFGDLKGNLGLDLAGPFVEGQKIDGSKGIGGVNCARDND